MCTHGRVHTVVSSEVDLDAQPALTGDVVDARRERNVADRAARFEEDVDLVGGPSRWYLPRHDIAEVHDRVLREGSLAQQVPDGTTLHGARRVRRRHAVDLLDAAR